MNTLLVRQVTPVLDERPQLDPGWTESNIAALVEDFLRAQFGPSYQANAQIDPDAKAQAQIDPGMRTRAQLDPTTKAQLDPTSGKKP